jgi:acyl carrier protein
MLDSATAAARDSSTDGAYVPFHYGELAVYAELPARCVSHVVRRPAGPGLIVADVTVYDPDGRVLAVASEFTMRAVADAGFAAQGTPKRTPGAGIEPAEGGRLFLTALAASGPAQVVVRPQADGKVVALAEVSAPIRVEAAPTVAAPVVAAPVPVKQNVAPARDGSIRDRLGALWAEVLGVPAIDGDEDFFDLGGNSLVAVELISRVRDDFGVAASIVSVFENPTLAGLATALTEQGAQ